MAYLVHCFMTSDVVFHEAFDNLEVPCNVRSQDRERVFLGKLQPEVPILNSTSFKS